MAKRGRPRKNPLPEEIKSLVDEVQEKLKLLQEKTQELHSQIEEINLERVLTIKNSSKPGEWDVKIGDSIKFFDRRLSYEITGYRPITETQGLDFNPSWFTEARDIKLKTGHYTDFYFGSKAYRDFWNEEYKRCREGLTVNGYTIPGSYYYFLNYYQLPNTQVKKLGTSRSNIFPEFYTSQYEFFSYLELCRVLKKDVCLMKSRGIGFSEINAAICDQIYNCYPDSVCMITAFSSNYLTKSLEKVWGGMDYANDNTDGGFFKLRQAIDKQDVKKASYYKIINGQKVETGWGSLIEGIVAEKDSKIRGDRVDLLVYEEAGSNPVLRKSYIKGNALVEIGGNRFGIRVVGGTGGDTGPSLDGLSDMYYNPESYNVLPYYHNYTESGDWEYTSFFIPSFAAFYREGYVDNRGVCNMEKAKAFYEEERRKLESTPKALIDYRAEYCFNAEEAFALEGTNNFNKVKLVEQLAAIKFKKNFVPKIERGWMEFTYKDGSRKRDSISGVRFKPDPNGPVHIIQHPLWKTSNDINPGETAEEYAERKKLDLETVSSVINNLYVAGIDGIDMGQELTSEATKDPSQFCTLIKRRVYGMKEPTYVAYYLDRPLNIELAYAQTVGLLYYYNCRANLEATRLSILGWAKKEKWILYFMRRPRICSGDPTKKRSFNTPYGTPASTAMITHGLDLVANYIEEYCHNIWFPELIDLLMKYTDEKKRKFDLVAAMLMTEIGDEELNDLNPVSAKPVNSEFQDIGYYKDEKGYTRFGVIPKRTLMNVKASWDNYDGKNVTSDPRYR